MVFSLLVAFIVTPWAAVRILKSGHAAAHGEREDLVTRVYRVVMGKLLHVPPLRWGFLVSVVVLLLGSVSLFYFQFVKVKMLPFDNKSEFQVIVDMPNGTTLEETARAANALARATLDQPEVVNLQTYVGTASPFNFNGLVRHYYLRQGSNVADIQVNLLPKGDRKLQSHEIAKQVRQRLLPVAEQLWRPHQGGRGAARAAGAGNAGGRSLRAGTERAHRHRAAHPRSVEAHRWRGGRRLVRGRRPAEVPADGGQREGRVERYFRRRHCPDHGAGLLRVPGWAAALGFREGRRAADAAPGPRQPFGPGEDPEPQSSRTNGPAGGVQRTGAHRGSRGR